jgi:hypothetical protein
MITAGAEMQVFVATKPVDFRNYAEQTIMQRLSVSNPRSCGLSKI